MLLDPLSQCVVKRVGTETVSSSLAWSDLARSYIVAMASYTGPYSTTGPCVMKRVGSKAVSTGRPSVDGHLLSLPHISHTRPLTYTFLLCIYVYKNVQYLIIYIRAKLRYTYIYIIYTHIHMCTHACTYMYISMYTVCYLYACWWLHRLCISKLTRFVHSREM